MPIRSYALVIPSTPGPVSVQHLSPPRRESSVGVTTTAAAALARVFVSCTPLPPPRPALSAMRLEAPGRPAAGATDE